ncbi:hypothetical protein EDB80DRAFT_190105 [Ilyonectria destructans]|nr:hypothetical protein EDB80DRAFT_190105 [Ilyonectria destructans]
MSTSRSEESHIFTIQTSMPPFPFPSNSTTDWTIPGTGIPLPLPFPTSLDSTVSEKPPFPQPSNSTISGTISGTGIPLPLPFPTSLDSTVSRKPPFPTSNSSMSGVSTGMSSSASGTSTPYSMPLNSTALTTPYGTDISSSSIASPPGTSTGTTRTSSIQSGLTSGPSSASSTPRYPDRNSTSSSSPWPTWVTTTAFNSTLPTESGTSRVSGDILPTLSVTSPIWTNGTSATPGASETVLSSGSVSQPPLSRPAGTTTGTGFNSTIEVSSMSPTSSPWITRGPSTIESSPRGPFPTHNSTGSWSSDTGAKSTSGVPSDGISAWNTTTTCTSTVTARNSTSSCTSTVSTTCSDSASYATVLPTTYPTANCSRSVGGTIPPWSFSPPLPVPPSSAWSSCNSTSSTSTCTSGLWANTTGPFTSKGSPTTLETVTRSDEDWNSGKPMYPTPTGKKSSEDELPDNPNYPWGGDSPIHRHQNATRLGDGTRDRDILPRSEWKRRWETAVTRLRAIWQQPPQQQRPEINDRGA